MLKVDRKTMILTSIVILLPLLVGVVFWRQLPDIMATHFGFNNEANGFSSKPFTVFGIPLILLGLHWLAVCVTMRDPRVQYSGIKIQRLCLWIVPVVSVICAIGIYPFNLGIKLDITFMGELFLGLMLVVVGNYLPKTRQNFYIGIRIPWTLASEENWNRTHRLAGFLWVAGGLVLLLLTLTGLVRSGLVVWLCVVVFVLPCLYSLWIYLQSGRERSR